MPSVPGSTRGRLMVAAAAVALLLLGWSVAGRASAKPISALLRIVPRTSIFDDEYASRLQEGRAHDAKAYCETITGRNVLTRAVLSLGPSHPALMPGKGDPVAWLEAEIHTEILPDPWFITVSMPGGRLEDQATIVNAVVKAFLAEVQASESQLRSMHTERLEAIANDYHKELTKSRQELREAEAKGATPEQIEMQKDKLAVREEMFRKLGLAVEERKLPGQSTNRVDVMHPAIPF